MPFPAVAPLVGRVLVWGSRRLIQGVMRGLIPQSVLRSRVGQWLLKHPLTTAVIGAGVFEVGDRLLSADDPSVLWVERPPQLPPPSGEAVVDVRSPEVEAAIAPELADVLEVEPSAGGRADAYPEEEALAILEQLERQGGARAPLIRQTITQVCGAGATRRRRRKEK